MQDELRNDILNIQKLEEHSKIILENIQRQNDELLNLCKQRNLKSLNGNLPWALDIGKTIVQDKNILSKIQKLINGLDEKSTKNVLRIIARLRTSFLSQDHQISNLTQKEIDELFDIERDFFPDIFQVNKEAFCYMGYFLPINHFEVGVFYKKHNLSIFEKKTLETIKSKDIIDVGGFIGDSAIIFEKEFTTKKIYSFEATATNYELMLKTLKLNNSTRIVPINKGLGAKNELLEISYCGSASTMDTKSLAYNDNNTQKCEIIKLDDFVEENKLEIGFIKVDIEGFEQEFLKGAINTIKTQKPAMLISIYHNASDFFDIKPLIESWNLGYTFKIYRPSDTWNFSIETALYCEIL